MTRIYKSIIVLVIFYMSFFSVKAELFDIWVHIGLATPSANVASLYTKSKFENDEDVEGFISKGTNIGWSVGINPRLILSDRANLSFFLGYAEFNPETAKAINTETDELESFFDTKTSVIPIKVGIDYYVVDDFLGTLGIYVKGDIQFNYLSNSINNIADWYDQALTLQNKEFGRLGAGIGLGFDVELPIIFDLGLDIEYNWLNLIGKEDDELSKNYLGLVLTIGL